MASPPFESPDRAIAKLAARQHGAVARWQLLRLGLSARQIEGRLRRGTLHAAQRGVYLAGHGARAAHTHEWIAYLACWPRAGGGEHERGGPPVAVTHLSATAIWELATYPPDAPVHVTVPPGRRIARPGVVVHRCALPSCDVRRRHGLPVSSPPRALLEIAALVEPEQLERTVGEAVYRGYATERELVRQLERAGRWPGVGALRVVLGLPEGPQRTRSRAERELTALLRASGLRGWRANARIHGYEVDVLWPAESLAVELDGYEAHRSRAAFERDRVKLAALQARGLMVLPLTPRRVRRDPAGAIRDIEAALALRRAALRAGPAQRGAR